MEALKRDTIDSISTLMSNTWSAQGSSTRPNSIVALPYKLGRASTDTLPATRLTPPPPSSKCQKLQPTKSYARLRSNSGLALHTNQAALLQYTDYTKHGSQRSTDMGRRPVSYDGGGIHSISRQSGRSLDIQRLPPQSRPLANFFYPEVIKAAFSSSTAGKRLWQFAKSRQRAAEVDFLIKADEYHRAFSETTSLIGDITKRYTGITATSPLPLPVDVSQVLQTNTKHCAKFVLPPLERLYQDARDSVLDRLTKELYPDFVKFQLTQCMRSSLLAGQSLRGDFKSAYPGLGEAFCLTDPHQRDNPIVFASDGLLHMSGYRRRELIGENCRILQGISNDMDTVQRLKQSIAMGRETVELIVNHRRDGTPYWNLLFICPLLEHGRLSYYFGAQINVSENMGPGMKDVLRVLEFSLPGEQFPPERDQPTPADSPKPEASVPSFDGHSLPELTPRSRTSGVRSTGQRFLGRFRKLSVTSSKPSLSYPVISSPSTTQSFSTTDRWIPTARDPTLQHSVDLEFCTPYSRYFVLRYASTTSQSLQSLQPQTRHHGVRLPVAFCSSSALELTGLKGHRIDSVLGIDIFSVVAGHANTPGINRNVRAAVLEKVGLGQPYSADLMVSTESAAPRDYAAKASRNRGMTVAGVGLGLTGQSVASDREMRPKVNGTFGRGAMMLNQMLFGSKLEKVVSHWTPLKNADGEVGWVVLILTTVPA